MIASVIYAPALYGNSPLGRAACYRVILSTSPATELEITEESGKALIEFLEKSV